MGWRVVLSKERAMHMSRLEGEEERSTPSVRMTTYIYSAARLSALSPDPEVHTRAIQNSQNILDIYNAVHCVEHVETIAVCGTRILR